MKRNLIFLVMMFSLVGVMGSVMADPLPTTVIVGEQTIMFTLNPTTLDFGNVIAGGEPKLANAPITFSVTQGNFDVTISVTDVSGTTILDGIQVKDTADTNPLNWINIIGKSGTVNCVPVNNLCTYPTPLSWDARLPVPLGTAANTYNAGIVYTITGTGPL